MAKRKGKKRHSRKKTDTKCDIEPEELVKAPHTFVINRGRLGKNVNELLMNFRKIMEPYTASELKVKKQNVVKDFVHAAGPLNVSHLIVFTKTEKGIYVRLAKLPKGPTLTFEVNEYCLAKDVITSQKKSMVSGKLFEHHPLLVLNNFTGEGMHFKLMATMFQHMIPSINVNKTPLNSIKRCLALHYNENKEIDLRHYAIKVVPAGLSRGVKKLMQSKIPNLGKYKEVEDFLKCGNLSESEPEIDDASNTVVLPQPISSRGNIVNEKSAIRLYEIGPRMKLKLIKIEEGFMSGDVMFHEYIKKTPEEIAALKAKIKQKRRLKEQRREQQRKNVEKKRKLKLANKEEEKTEDNDEWEDLEWYRKEVGKDPDENAVITMKRKFSSTSSKYAKKIKLSTKNSKLVKKKDSSNKLGDNKKAFDQFMKKKRQKKNKLLKKKAKGQSRKISAVKPKHKEVKIKKKV